MRSFLVFVFGFLPLVAAADPLKSDACGASLQALESARRLGGTDVEALRREATRSCLGGAGEARRPSPTAQAPVVVPPPVIAAPAQEARPESPPSPPLPPRPAFVTSCDLGGCWDSEGRRLGRSGPLLVGPHGTCASTGTTVVCP